MTVPNLHCILNIQLFSTVAWDTGSGGDTSSTEYHSATREQGSDLQLMYLRALLWKTQFVFHPLCRSTCQEYVPGEQTNQRVTERQRCPKRRGGSGGRLLIPCPAGYMTGYSGLVSSFSECSGQCCIQGFLSHMWQWWFTSTAVLTLILSSGKWHGDHRQGQMVFYWWLLFSPCWAPACHVPSRAMRGLLSFLHSVSSPRS